MSGLTKFPYLCQALIIVFLLAGCRPDGNGNQRSPEGKGRADRDGFVLFYSSIPDPANKLAQDGLNSNKLPDGREYEFAAFGDEDFGLILVASGALGQGVGVQPPPGVNDSALDAKFNAANGYVELKSGFSYGVRVKPGNLPPEIGMKPGKWRTPWKHVVTRHVSTGAFDTRYIALSSGAADDSRFPHSLGFMQRSYWQHGIVKVETNDGASRVPLCVPSFVQCESNCHGQILVRTDKLSAGDIQFCNDAKEFFDKVLEAEGMNEPIWNEKFDAMMQAATTKASPK